LDQVHLLYLESGGQGGGRREDRGQSQLWDERRGVSAMLRVVRMHIMGDFSSLWFDGGEVEVG
jgi:hypothetical protein